MPTQEELKTDRVRVQITKGLPSCRVEFEIFADRTLIDEARRKAIKSIRKEMEYPGFRKGKAPEDVVLQKHGAIVEKELHRELADLAYVEVQKQTRIPLLNNNAPVNFQMKKFAEDEAHLHFNFETEPEIPSVDAKTFTAKPVERPPVTQKEIDEAIFQMGFYFAEWKTVDRAVQDGDYIMIDLDTVDDNGNPQKVFDHIRFQVSKERMATWMRNAVNGAKTGVPIAATSEADDDASEEERKQFKPKPVTLTIHKIEEAKLPEIDDDFAKKVGAPDKETMIKSITDLLTKRADEKVDNEKREQVNDFLTQQYTFELPHSLVETEKKHRLDQLKQNPKFKQSFDKMSAEEKQVTEENVFKEAEAAVRLFYLSRKIVSDVKIPITHQQIHEEAVATLRSYGSKDTDKIPKEVYALALSKLILSKAQEYILTNQNA